MQPKTLDKPRPGNKAQVICHDLDKQGRGLARWNNWVLVLPGLLPGETAEIMFIRRIGSQWLASVQEIKETSKYRRNEPCIIASKCGGCNLQHCTEDFQRDIKLKQLDDSLKRIGNIKHEVDQIIYSPSNQMGYRNKAIIPVSKSNDGVIKFGYYKYGTHQIVNLYSCPVLITQINYIIPFIRDKISLLEIPIYSETSDSEGLRHVIIRTSTMESSLVTFVSSSLNYSKLNELSSELYNTFDTITGVSVNIQQQRNNIILGPKTISLYGNPYLEEIFCELTLRITSTSFFQINTKEAEKVVIIIRDWLVKNNIKSLLDCYCGIGSISLPIANCGIKVTGIDINKSSIEIAKQNSKNNGIQTQFYCTDVKNILKEKLSECDALVVDPPRKGLDKEIIDSILEIKPKLIAYLSCDKATLARDLNIIVNSRNYYRIVRIIPIEFFPQTTHLETLVLLEYNA